MSRLRPSTGTVVGFIALMVALGGTALAATGQLVHIVDRSNTSQLARVDTAGKVYVGDGAGGLTVDGTVSARETAPLNLVRFSVDTLGSQSCRTLYAPPSGSAAIVKDVEIATYHDGGTPDNLDRVLIWLGTEPCGGALVGVHNSRATGNYRLAFGTGLGIPAGYQLSTSNFSTDKQFYITGFGYRVPSSAVPPSAVSAAASGTPTTGAAAGTGER